MPRRRRSRGAGDGPVRRSQSLGLVAAARAACAAALALALCACGTLRYYAHVTHGELSLLAHREPIVRIVDDPHADATLRARLAQAARARDFASDALDLPRNASYRSYVDLGRPYATWNVFATPEFSVDPITHCFAFAGCVAYLGFFDRDRAEGEAKLLETGGDDVAIEGAAAYSTLGWFADPILSSMMRWSDAELDGVIFHELAHEKIYVRDDTAFNESFANFVQQEGLDEWRRQASLPAPDPVLDAHDRAFTTSVLDLRSRLRTIYAKPIGAGEMRREKREAFEDFRSRYRSLRDSEWKNDSRYDAWFARPLNNARLVPFGLYDRFVPAFRVLFEQNGRDWSAFYRAVAALAKENRDKRAHALEALLATGSR